MAEAAEPQHPFPTGSRGFTCAPWDGWQTLVEPVFQGDWELPGASPDSSSDPLPCLLPAQCICHNNSVTVAAVMMVEQRPQAWQVPAGQPNTHCLIQHASCITVPIAQMRKLRLKEGGKSTSRWSWDLTCGWLTLKLLVSFFKSIPPFIHSFIRSSIPTHTPYAQLCAGWG